MKTIITHNKPCPNATTLLAGGSITYNPEPGATVTVICNSDNARVITEVEPEPIPMSEMTPHTFAVITSCNDESLSRLVGVTCYCYMALHADTKRFVTMAPNHTSGTADGIMVRIIQPGESLLIEVVADTPETPNEPAATPESESAGRRCIHCKHRDVGHFSPPCSDDCLNTVQHKHFAAAEPDDKFERLADGTRKSCTTCKHCHLAGDALPCSLCHGLDSRGAEGHSHERWEPIVPKPRVSGAVTWQGQRCDECMLEGVTGEVEPCMSCVADWQVVTGVNECKQPHERRDRLDLFKEKDNAGN
jgi:hypothetical protein